MVAVVEDVDVDVDVDAGVAVVVVVVVVVVEEAGAGPVTGPSNIASTTSAISSMSNTQMNKILKNIIVGPK